MFSSILLVLPKCFNHQVRRAESKWFFCCNSCAVCDEVTRGQHKGASLFAQEIIEACLSPQPPNPTILCSHQLQMELILCSSTASKQLMTPADVSAFQANENLLDYCSLPCLGVNTTLLEIRKLILNMINKLLAGLRLPGHEKFHRGRGFNSSELHH